MANNVNIYLYVKKNVNIFFIMSIMWTEVHKSISIKNVNVLLT